MNENERIANVILNTPDAPPEDVNWAKTILGNIVNPQVQHSGSSQLVSDAAASPAGQALGGSVRMFADAASTPGAMIRAGVGAAENGGNILGAMGHQLLAPANTAPTWGDLTKGMSEKPILGNPFGVTPQSLAEAAGEVFGEPINYLPLPIRAPAPVTGALEKLSVVGGRVANAIPRAIAEAGEATTKIPANAYLKYAGTGRELINQMAGQEQGIGEKIFDLMDRAAIPEEAQAVEIINKMGDVSTAGVIRALTDAIPHKPTPEMEPVVDKIQKQIDHFLEISGGYEKMEMPATELRNQQLQLRETLHDMFGKESRVYHRALKSAQAAITRELRDEAPAEYREIMSIWAKKLRIIDILQARLGADAATREDRINNFVRSIWGSGGSAKNRQSIIARLDDLFGENILKESEAAAAARQLGIREGSETAANTMPWKTGFGLMPVGAGATLGAATHMLGGSNPATLLSALAGLATGSPRFMSAMTRGGQNAADALKYLGREAATPGGASFLAAKTAETAAPPEQPKISPLTGIKFGLVNPGINDDDKNRITLDRFRARNQLTR